MRQFFMVLVVGALALGGVSTGTAVAAPGHLKAKVQVSAHRVSTTHVRLAGTTAHVTGRVTIQKKTSRGWKKAGTARVRDHKFARTVRAKARTTHFRAARGKYRSRVVTVRRAPLRQAPSPARPTASTQPAPIQPALTQPTPTPTTDRTPDACGARIAKPDGSLWSCTFDSEFNGTSLNTDKWVPQNYFYTSVNPTDVACAENNAHLIKVSGGSLHLSVDRTDPSSIWASQCKWTFGMVSTYHKFSQEYGRVEARIRFPAYRGPGIHSAFWMWPDDRVSSTATWPAAGEIDVAEHYTSTPDIAIPYLHYTANDNGGFILGTNTAGDCTIQPGQYNTYTLVWTPTTITILYNGKTCLVNTSADPAFQKPYILDLTETVGTYLNQPDSNTPFPSTMDIDYVHVWK